jgi:membrane protease YdiL (CAAX protease family)
VREFLFPSTVSLSADFPWNRGVLRTFGVLLVGLLTVVFAPIIPMLFLLFAQQFVVALIPGAAEFLAANKLFVMMALQLVLQVVGFGAAIWFLKSRIPGSTLTEVTSFNLKTLGGRYWKAFVAGFLGYICAIALTALYLQVFPINGAPHDPAAELGRTLSGGALVLFAVSTMFLAPLLEEIVFRGFFFNMLRSSFRNRLPAGIGDFSAVVVSGAIFAAVHGTLTGFPMLFIIGMVLAEVYRRTGSLHASIAMHFINNTVVTVMLILSLSV